MIWSHLLTWLTFSYSQKRKFFPFKNTFFQQEETFSKNKHFPIKWKLKAMAFLFFPTHAE